MDWLWDKMGEILESLRKPPYKTLVLTGHSLGKSFLAAAAINWWYDTFNPGAVISTAPTERDVKQIIWKEIRLQRMHAGLSSDFIGIAAPEMRTSPNHYAMGFTARRGESFVGRHDRHMLFVFDECVGVDPQYWETAKTMFKPGPHSWLCIGNPTDTTSEAYSASLDGTWAVFNLSSMDHPNIAAELAGLPPPVPAAVSVAQIDQWVEDWCDEIKVEDRQAMDFEWQPGSGNWFRPGPIFQSRVQGQWPDQGARGVWNKHLWQTVEKSIYDFPANELPEIGVDVALFGDDMTAIHARWGDTSIHHEEYNSQDEEYTAWKVMALAKQLCKQCNERRQKGTQPFLPQQVPIKVDREACGGGVASILQAHDFLAIPIRAGSRANCPSDYPNRRSELWFATVQRAKDRRLGLGLLKKETLKELRAQAMSPTWRLVVTGQLVEPKDMTKDKLGRSPDGMDAVNLAYYRTPEFVAIGVVPEKYADDVPLEPDREAAIVETEEQDGIENSPWRSSRPDWFGGRHGRPDWF